MGRTLQKRFYSAKKEKPALEEIRSAGFSFFADCMSIRKIQNSMFSQILAFRKLEESEK
jgi:hypothetical protein